ncbi:MAG: trigger factor [Oscillospiraceae bacterium]|nr:trigger factor [Oscillospiraceae bacterium]
MISQYFGYYAPENLRKRLITLLIVVLCGFVLVGCANSAPANDVGGDVSAETPTVGNGVAEEPSETGASDADEEIDIFEYVTLGAYKGIEFDPVPFVAVTDADIDMWIDEHLQGASAMVEITDRAVLNGDTVLIDFEGFQDGVAFQGGSAQDFELRIGSGQFIPGFEEQIIGHNIGDEFDINVSFPEVYHAPELAGQAVVFRINLHAIFALEIPELTDEFVREVADVDSVEEFRQQISEQLEAERVHVAENTERSQVWREVISNVTIHKHPEHEIERRVSDALEEYSLFAMMNGMELEDMIEMFTGMSLEEFIEAEIRVGAIDAVEQDLILRAIAVQEGIVVSEDEFDEAVAQFVEDFGFDDAEQFLEINGEDTVRFAILADKIINFIMEYAVAR